ncbi:MAG: divergent PAP2 family protein [Pseudomonadota bacterium]|nr:divergent PAP2 family protein [Pseudomonadota bacterium]
MDLSYLLTPLLTWLVVGPIKFLITSVRQRRLAFNLVGNGGFPSNHSAVVTSMATLIALHEGIGHPAFGVAVTLAFIVMIDANSLRQHVGRHAAAINRLAAASNADAVPAAASTAAAAPATGQHVHLRERMGHTLVEIGGGIVTGIAMGHLIYWLLVPH